MAGGVAAPRRTAPSPRLGSNQARPSSSATRPGSRPGASPMSRAPITLPRRRAGRKRAVRPGLGHGGGGLGHEGPVLGQRRPAEDHHHAVTAGAGAPERAGRRRPGVDSSTDVGASAAAGQGPDQRRRPRPGR